MCPCRPLHSSQGPPTGLEGAAFPTSGCIGPSTASRAHSPGSLQGWGGGGESTGRGVGSQYGVSASCHSLAESGILLYNLKFCAFSIGVQRMLMECSRLQSAVQTDAGCLGVLLPPDLSVCLSSPRPLLPSKCSTLLPASPSPMMIGTACGEEALVLVTDGDTLNAPQSGPGCESLAPTSRLPPRLPRSGSPSAAAPPHPPLPVAALALDLRDPNSLLSWPSGHCSL